MQADLILSEGIATWGAGRYWLGRYQSFRAFVAAEYGGNLLPLATDPRGGVAIATLNQLYYQWASFVEWLVEQHGRPALDRLYSSGKNRALTAADYPGVLGTGFDEAESQWRAWIDAHR